MEKKTFVLGVVTVVVAIVGIVPGYADLLGSSSQPVVVHEQPNAGGRVFASLKPGPDGFPVSRDHGRQVTEIVLDNETGPQVHDAVVSLVFIQGAAPHTAKELVQDLHGFNDLQSALSEIPPGRSETEVAGNWAGMFRVPGVEIAYTDVLGQNWLRSAEGQLTRIAQPAAQYYGLPEPLDWRVPLQN